MVMTILPRALRFAIVSSPLSASSSGRARSTSIVSVPSSKSAISLLSESRLVPAMIIWPVRPAAARRPLEVIVPRGTTDAEVDELLEEKRHWVERKVATAREIARRPPRLGLERPGLVWLGGAQPPLERRSGRRSVATLDDRREWRPTAGRCVAPGAAARRPARPTQAARGPGAAGGGRSHAPSPPSSRPSAASLPGARQPRRPWFRGARSLRAAGAPRPVSPAR